MTFVLVGELEFAAGIFSSGIDVCRGLFSFNLWFCLKGFSGVKFL